MSNQTIDVIQITDSNTAQKLAEAFRIPQPDLSKTAAALLQTSDKYGVVIRSGDRLSTLTYFPEPNSAIVLEEVFANAEELVTTKIIPKLEGGADVIQTRQDFVNKQSKGEAELLPLTEHDEKSTWQRVNDAVWVAKNVIHQTLTP